MTSNYKMIFPEYGLTFYPTHSGYDIMSFDHEIGLCFVIPRDSKMKNLKE